MVQKAAAASSAEMLDSSRQAVASAGTAAAANRLWIVAAGLFAKCARWLDCADVMSLTREEILSDEQLSRDDGSRHRCKLQLSQPSWSTL